jgi:transposase-like protein
MREILKEYNVKTADDITVRSEHGELELFVPRDRTGAFHPLIVKKHQKEVIGIDMDGYKDVLGMYIGENETSKFWLTVLNELKNRGVEDVK